MSFDGGHDSHPPLIGCGGGGGFIHQVCEKPHPPPSSEELDNNQKKYGGHHRFDPLGSGGGTRRSRRTSITDSSSSGESVSVTTPIPTPTATDLLSQIINYTAFKPITRKAPVSVVEAMLFDYLPKSSICSPPPDLMHVEANNSQGDDYDFPGFESEDDKFYYEVDSDDDDDDSGDDESVYYSNDDDDDEYYHPSSQIRYALVEVLSVIINKNKYMEKNPSLYGTICLNDGIKGPVYIYNTKREDSESISLSGGGRKARLSLTGHSRAVAAIDNFSMEVDLMDNKGSKLSPDDDDVFCRGIIHWQLHIPLVRKYEDGEVSSVHQFLPYKYIYDKPLAADFVGRSGSVKVNYIMWWEGVRATVEVTLLNRKGADVYGLIRAGNSHIRGISYYCSVLFEKKKSDESIDVPPGQLIPLSRSVVAVNYSSSLTVLVDLYDRHRNRDLSQNYEIAKGTANFPAQEFGTVEKNISGRHGKIRVKVTWMPL